MTTCERPILFSAPMVRAILAGTKTQTRRTLKPQPTHFNPAGVPRRVNPDGGPSAVLACPYGKPGDRLWVRESWRACSEADAVPPRDMDAAYRVWFEADAFAGRFHQPGYGKLRPGMFMPRWASRITLEVTSVRVERLRDITRGDAMAEGCPFPNMAKGDSPRRWFEYLWRQINGVDSWDANPLVWVVSFTRLEPK